MASSGWKSERDGSFSMPVSSRRQKPPPATPWGRLELEWRMKVSKDCHWGGSLKEVLEAAEHGMRQANKAPRKVGMGSRWESVEAFLQGYAKGRHWIISMDPAHDLVTISPNPGRQPMLRRQPNTDASQPCLFDEDLT